MYQFHPNEAEAKYKELITDAFMVNAQGEKIDGDAFADAEKVEASGEYPVLLLLSTQKKYVLALQGKGLWGPIWAISQSMTIRTLFWCWLPVTSGETPGLAQK